VSADRVQELLEIEAIRNLKARYCLACDSHDWEAYRAVFADDARIVGDLPADGGDAPVYGPDEWTPAVAATLSMKSFHMLHQSIVELTGPDSACGLWVYEQRGFGHTGGTYEEEYVKADGAWKIASMRITAIHRHDPDDPLHSPPGSWEPVAGSWERIAAAWRRP
jgi:hypothetical protein